MPKHSSVLPNSRLIRELQHRVGLSVTEFLDLPGRDIKERTYHTILNGAHEVDVRSLAAIHERLAHQDIHVDDLRLQLRPCVAVGFPPLPKRFYEHKRPTETLQKSLYNAWRASCHKSPCVQGGRFILSGPPGTGKTTLVNALAQTEKTRARFHDGVYFLHIGSEPNYLALQNRLIQWVMGPDAPLQINSDDARSKLAHAFAGKNILLVLDDIRNQRAQHEFDIGAWTLITTQNPNVLDTTIAETVSLSDFRFTQNELVQFLKETSDSTRLSLGHALAIAELCDYNTYGLHTAARLKASTRYSWPALIDKLSNELKSSFTQASPPGTELAPFKTAVTNLPAATRENLLILSSAPEHAIFSETSFNALWNIRNTQPHIQELLDYGLLLRHTKENQYRLHTLVYRLIQDMRPPTSAGHELIAKTYSLTLNETLDQKALDPYFWNHFAYHCFQGNREDLFSLVRADFRWYQTRWNTSHSILEIASDLALFQTDSTRDIARSLSLAVAALSRDPKQLAAQFIARLPRVSDAESDITQILEGAKRAISKNAFEPILPTLLPNDRTVTALAQADHSQIEALANNNDELLATAGQATLSTSYLNLWRISRNTDEFTIDHWLRHRIENDSITAMTSWETGLICFGAKSGSFGSFTWIGADLNICEFPRKHYRRINRIEIFGNRALTVADDGAATLWDLENQEPLHTLQLSHSKIADVAIANNTFYAIAVSTSKIYSLHIANDRLNLLKEDSFPSPLTSVRFQAQAERWISGDLSGNIIIQTFETSDRKIFPSCANGIIGIDVARNDQTLIRSRTGYGYYWINGEIERQPDYTFNEPGRSIKSAVPTKSDHVWITGCSHGQLKSRILRNQRKNRSYASFDSPVVGLAIDSQRETILAFDETGSRLSWNIDFGDLLSDREPALLQPNDRIIKVALIQSHDLLAMGTSAGEVLLSEYPTPTIPRRIKVSNTPIVDLQFDHTSKTLLVIAQRSQVFRIFLNRQKPDQLTHFLGHTPTSLAIDQKGNYYIGLDDGTLANYSVLGSGDPLNMTLREDLGNSSLSAIALMPNDQIIVGNTAGEIIFATTNDTSVAHPSANKITSLHRYDDIHFIATSTSGSLMAWNTQENTLKAQFNVDDPITVSTSWRDLTVIGDQSGRVHFLRANL